MPQHQESVWLATNPFLSIRWCPKLNHVQSILSKVAAILVNFLLFLPVSKWKWGLPTETVLYFIQLDSHVMRGKTWSNRHTLASESCSRPTVRFSFATFDSEPPAPFPVPFQWIQRQNRRCITDVVLCPADRSLSPRPAQVSDPPSSFPSVSSHPDSFHWEYQTVWSWTCSVQCYTALTKCSSAVLC